MNPFLKMMNATRIFGAIILTLGIAIFIYGMIVSDYVYDYWNWYWSRNGCSIYLFNRNVSNSY